MSRAVACAIAAAAVAGLAGPARAEPAPQLSLTREPPPRHLRMRPRAAAATPPPARPATPMPAAPPPPPDLASDQPAAVRDVREPVSFSLTIGYQVDGARPSGKASLDAPVQEGRDYSALRSYGFGELFFSTRGVALDSLSSYLSLRLDAAQRETFESSPQLGLIRLAPPIETWFERTTFETRTGWAEIKDFLPKRLGLRKLRLRGGNQYVYGPWVLHLDGVLVAYDGDIVTATAYAGGRHTDYTTELADEGFAVAGGSLRLDLRKLVDLPIAITGDTLAMRSDLTGVPDSSHQQLEVDWQPRRDLTVLAQARTLDNKLANEQLQLRARYHEVSNLAIDVTRRYSTDWRWDPSLIASDDPTSARRYLDLGPVLPQVTASLRAGTLLFENVDLLARATLAGDLTPDGEAKSSFSAAYYELAGAAELRLRRTISLGGSVLSRSTQRDDTVIPILDVRLTPQPLPPSAATGETGFTEVGGRMRLSLGARQLSALVEVYGRRTRYPQDYVDPTNPIKHSELRGGGRVSIDAWIGKRLRLFASYDLSSGIDFQPEITSYKSLRLTMTGVY